ncbi:hypothetical protein H5410_010190 [Solanum commersonii]|uniref:Uncharacterized protein n=1 Tax=Solanum commersonii TaxID=4109 RepID=A0A9J6AKX2_SOLCO|nr:hypothetical protein H5410_010190 [Solanum commersonii]
MKNGETNVVSYKSNIGTYRTRVIALFAKEASYIEVGAGSFVVTGSGFSFAYEIYTLSTTLPCVVDLIKLEVVFDGSLTLGKAKQDSLEKGSEEVMIKYYKKHNTWKNEEQYI